MTPVALVQKRTGTEKMGYLLAFTNILNITQIRASKTYFLKESFSLSVGCFWTIAKIHINAEKIHQKTRHQISLMLRDKIFDGCQQAIKP